MEKLPVLIVGLGVSALSVIKHFQALNVQVQVVADDSQKASEVAGGLLNPASLKRLKPVWKVEEFYPYALQFYKENVPDFYEKLPLLRIFSSVEEQNRWFEQLDNVRLSPFLSPKLIPNFEGVNAKFQLGEVLNSAVIHLKDTLQQMKSVLQQTNSFFEETFTYSSLHIENDNLTYGGKSYSHVIFCEGFGVLNNPYFNWLPIYGNQGEYIHVRFNEKCSFPIVKGKHFLIPTTTPNVYKFGATYNRSIKQNDITLEAKKILVDDLKKMINSPFEVVYQEAGIRPTTRDRHPVLGLHPQYNRLAILNGMGSRGVVCAPLLGRQLVELILEGKEPFKEVSLNRFTA